MRYILAILLVVLAAVVGGTRATAQSALSLRIAAPANGQTVQNPIRVRVDIAGGTVAEASAGDPQALHYHILVDVDPATVIQPGQPLPTGRSEVLHTANQDFPLTALSPGQHTITAVLTRGDHVPLSPNVQDQVTFTVAAGQATPAATAVATPVTAPPAGMPRTGVGISGESGFSWRLIAMVGLVPVLVAGAAVWVRRHRAY